MLKSRINQSKFRLVSKRSKYAPLEFDPMMYASPVKKLRELDERQQLLSARYKNLLSAESAVLFVHPMNLSVSHVQKLKHELKEKSNISLHFCNSHLFKGVLLNSAKWNGLMPLLNGPTYLAHDSAPVRRSPSAFLAEYFKATQRSSPKSIVLMGGKVEQYVLCPAELKKYAELDQTQLRAELLGVVGGASQQLVGALSSCQLVQLLEQRVRQLE